MSDQNSHPFPYGSRIGNRSLPCLERLSERQHAPESRGFGREYGATSVADRANYTEARRAISLLAPRCWRSRTLRYSAGNTLTNLPTHPSQSARIRSASLLSVY